MKYTLAQWAREYNPSLLDEWDWKNNQHDPEKIGFKSHKEASWICKLGHPWTAVIATRTARGDGCPYCSGKRVLAGFNDLATTDEKLAKEFHPTQNDFKPTEITAGSEKEAVWMCQENHCWQAPVYSRKKSGCPYCAGRKVQKDYNDLLTKNSFLCKDWAYDLNKKGPDEYTEFSSEKVWWRCHICGKEWESTINHRSNGRGCKRCNASHKTSVNEFAVGYYVSKLFECQNNIKPSFLKGQELDLYIPEIKTGVEYDGAYYHKDRHSKELEKNKKCAENGIRLIRLRERGLPSFIDCETIWVTPSDYDSINDGIKNLTIILCKDNCSCKTLDVDVKRDYQSILAMRYTKRLENSVGNKHKELLEDWDYELNKVDPYNIAEKSNFYAHWKCHKCDYKWESVIATRSNGAGCPNCKGKALIKGVNDFATVHKDDGLVQYWSPRNEKGPDEYHTNSHESVLWICPECGEDHYCAIRTRPETKSCRKCYLGKARKN